MLHPSSDIEITKYFNYKSTLNGFFERDNLPRIKHGASKVSMTK